MNFTRIGRGHMRGYKQGILKLFVSLLAILLAHSASAEWYIGADTIDTSPIPTLNSLSNNTLVDQNISEEQGLSLVGGFRTSKYFSVQVEYQDEISFGLDDMYTGSSLWFPEDGASNFDSNVIFFSGISSYPITDHGALYMKGGVYNWEVESDVLDSKNGLTETTRGTDIFYGFGANYDLNARFGISAEWERYELDESGVDYLSTEVKFKF